MATERFGRRRGRVVVFLCAMIFVVEFVFCHGLPLSLNRPENSVKKDIPTSETVIRPTAKKAEIENAKVPEIDEHGPKTEKPTGVLSEESGKASSGEGDKRRPPGTNVKKPILTERGGEDVDTHFFSHMVVIGCVVILIYVTYHSREKLSVLAKKSRWNRGPRNDVVYRRLDENVHEAMPTLKMAHEYIF